VRVACILAALLLPCDPPLSDCDRFPPREVACQAIQFNRAYRRSVAARQRWELHHWWYWQEVLDETDWLYRCWDNLYTAEGGEGDDEESRRQSLRRLRELLGDDAYYGGRMPPAAPFWRFTWID